MSALTARRGRRSSGAAHDGDRGRQLKPPSAEASALTLERQRATAWSEADATRRASLSAIVLGWTAAQTARRPLRKLVGRRRGRARRWARRPRDAAAALARRSATVARRSATVARRSATVARRSATGPPPRSAALRGALATPPAERRATVAERRGGASRSAVKKPLERGGWSAFRYLWRAFQWQLVVRSEQLREKERAKYI